MEQNRLKPILIERHFKRDKFNNWLNKYECPYCGNILLSNEYRVNSGSKSNCGCMSKTFHQQAAFKHGYVFSRLYRIWGAMLARCKYDNGYNPIYIRKNIKVATEWNDFIPFKDWALSNGYKENLVIDRIDNDGNYCPENCRWVTTKVNNRNGNATKLTIDQVIEIKKSRNNGITQKETAKIFQVTQCTISAIRRGSLWSDIQIPETT